jgi:L-ascorbate metabolism protein UlaG (beta-lactamase superfamily)
LYKLLIFVILIAVLTISICACSQTTTVTDPTPIPTAAPTPSPKAPDAEVIYYDMSGFLVQVGGKKIMIDTLFASFSGHNPPPAAFELMINGDPPFDQIDLVLTTHTDVDHFSAEVMSMFLQNNPDTVLVSTYQVVEDLTQENPNLTNPLYAVDLQAGETEVISLDGIEVECLYLSHGVPDLLNLGFIVSVDQISFFHSGDIAPVEGALDTLLAYGLPDRDLDIALVVYHLLAYEENHYLLSEGIQAAYIIPTHYSYHVPLDPIAAFPDAILFSTPMERWQMP